MQKKELNEEEKRLLNTSSIDELIKIKMEEELKAEIQKANEKPSKQIITDIAKVPKDLIFSKHSVYKLFHRTNKTECYINGLQAEAMLGLQNAAREKIKTGQIDAFSTESAYVKFEKIEF